MNKRKFSLQLCLDIFHTFNHGGCLPLPRLTFSSVSNRGLDAERLMPPPSLAAPSSSFASCSTPKLLVLRRLCLQMAGARESSGSMVRLEPPENCMIGIRGRESGKRNEGISGQMKGTVNLGDWHWGGQIWAGEENNHARVDRGVQACHQQPMTPQAASKDYCVI